MTSSPRYARRQGKAEEPAVHLTCTGTVTAGSMVLRPSVSYGRPSGIRSQRWPARAADAGWMSSGVPAEDG